MTSRQSLEAVRPTQNIAEPNDWWHGAVIYQIYPRSFCDANADGVGDLPGIVARLDYVADLGVDAIWISPFFKSPMRDFGYDVADFCDVDPVFGTLADFDALVAKAHNLGLKVVIDQVYSHTSDECAWFTESRRNRTNAKADWYVWADAKPDGSPPNNWQSVFGGAAWTWDESRSQYYLHNFLSAQPDLNVRNPDVQRALLDVATFWLERGVDGFRLDAANYYMHDASLRDNPPTALTAPNEPPALKGSAHNKSQPENLRFIENLRALMNRYPGRFTVAEIGDHDAIAEMADYTAGNNRLNTAYSFVFIDSEEVCPNRIRTAIEQWSQASDAWPAWTFSNHDRARVVSRWGRDKPRQAFANLMNALLLTLRGIAFVYQGEELGLPQSAIPFEKLRDPEAIRNWPQTLGRDGARTPMPWTTATHGGWPVDPWLPMDPKHVSLAVEAQAQDPKSCLTTTKSLLRLRHASPTLRYGEISFLTAPPSVLAFERRFGGNRLLCVFNLADAPMSWPNAPAVGNILLALNDTDRPDRLPALGALIAEVL
ncbi:MAG: alpha glucosidase [Sphingomonadales bacterium]